jgi:hypothetical protein
MITPAFRIALALAIAGYCASRLVAAYRVRVCVTFLGQKYYRAEGRGYYWLVVFAHIAIAAAMAVNIAWECRSL